MSSSVPGHSVPSVLLVDDTVSNLIALSAVLSPLGVRIVQALSGPEALSRVREESFAVALLDVQMPGMDGLSVAQHIRELPLGRELPIIFLTAIHRDEAFMRRGYAVGAADYVTKPFDVEILRARVKAFVDLFQQREEVRRTQLLLHTRERDEALRRAEAFERITTATLGDADHQPLLEELLSIFVDSSDAADFAKVFLRAGDDLQLSAQATRCEQNARRLPTSAHELNFLTSLSHARGALEWTDLRDASPGSGGAGAGPLRTLFGVPLTDDAQGLLGVAYVASCSVPAFSEREKRLFCALSERASWAVTKRMAQQRMQSILGGAPALIAIFRGRDHVAEFVNERAAAFLGGEGCVGKPARELGLQAHVLQILRRVYDSGAVHSSNELALTPARGAEATRYFNVTAQPLRGPRGTIDSVQLFAVDVTLQVEARRELEAHQRERARLLERERAARTEAELASRTKDEFLATLSHELRTPLNAVLGWTARARAKAGPEVERALSIVARNAEAQARIIEDLLDLSRIISGKLVLDVVPTPLYEPITGALEAVRHAAEAKELSVELNVREDLFINADPHRIQQVIWNLLSNAIKFTEKGGKVWVDAHASGHRAIVRVSDTGQGIAPEFLSGVFAPFQQADGSSTRRHGGLGLGLAIVRQLVQAHGGTVRAESDGPGRGSRFVIELPLHAPANDNARPDTARQDVERRLDRVKVLVVDDEPDALSLLSEVLSETGARVRTAESVAGAVQALKTFRPHVLISDIAMPGADGYSLIRQVRKLPKHEGGATKAIALTAYARSEDAQRALSAGFEIHLAKPVNFQALIGAIQRLSSESLAR
jgi:signal transduction histidine kinase/DNA-binding response OmpR family regulator